MKGDGGGAGQMKRSCLVVQPTAEPAAARDADPAEPPAAAAFVRRTARKAQKTQVYISPEASGKVPYLFRSVPV